MTRIFAVLMSSFLVSCGVGGEGSSSISPLVSLRATAFGSGTLSIEGTVALPDTSVEGSSVKLYLTRSTGTGGGNQEKTGVVTTTAHEVRYSISGLPSGDYKLRIQVDETGNGIFSERGDLEGWYSGTTSTPVQNETTGATIVLVSVSRFNMNFGIGLIP